MFQVHLWAKTAVLEVGRSPNWNFSALKGKGRVLSTTPVGEPGCVCLDQFSYCFCSPTWHTCLQNRRVNEVTAKAGKYRPQALRPCWAGLWAVLTGNPVSLGISGNLGCEPTKREGFDMTWNTRILFFFSVTCTRLLCTIEGCWEKQRAWDEKHTVKWGFLYTTQLHLLHFY